MILKSYPYLKDEASKQILLQYKDPDETILKQIFKNNNPIYVKSKIQSFLSEIIMDRVQYQTQEFEDIKTGVLPEEKQEEIRVLVNDYINMCFLNKKKISLTIKSIKELQNKHDQLSTQYRYVQEVKIPKKSKFNTLRKILPKEFEWIKTKKRLIQEAKIQHHCVASYAGYITEEKCAIYSYVDYTGEFAFDQIPRRYTIEFCINKNGEYYVEQTQGRYDQVNASKLSQFIISKYLSR